MIRLLDYFGIPLRAFVSRKERAECGVSNVRQVLPTRAVRVNGQNVHQGNMPFADYKFLCRVAYLQRFDVRCKHASHKRQN